MSAKLHLSENTLATAIDQGLAYLAESQRPTGEFATLTAPKLEMVQAVARPKSTYITSFVMHALTHLPTKPIIEQIRQQAAAFLLQEHEMNGAWHYDGRGNRRPIPTDLDCTACAVAALLQLEQRPTLSFYSLLWQNEVEPGGPYYTWLGVDHNGDSPFARDIDALVNANILFCGGLLNLSLTGASAYLQQVIDAEAYLAQSVYCVSPHFPIYAISRAYADGQVRALSPAMPAMRQYILDQLSPPQAEPSAFNLACLAVSLLNLNSPIDLVEPYLATLRDRQQPDGHWPGWAAYLSYNRYYDGSPALTTALALEALGKYLLTSFGRFRPDI